jgi:hypothetical protein
MFFHAHPHVSSSGLRALAVSTAVVTLTLAGAVAALGQTVTSGHSKGDSGVYTITNDTLAHAGSTTSRAPVVTVNNQRPGPSSSGNCLPLAELNQDGARAADLAEQYFLSELDSLARNHDLATANGWLNAAPKMSALASRISSQAGQVYDEEARKMLFQFADDIRETASWVASRPSESAEKYQRGEAIFSRRF